MKTEEVDHGVYVVTGTNKDVAAMSAPILPPELVTIAMASERRKRMYVEAIGKVHSLYELLREVVKSDELAFYPSAVETQSPHAPDLEDWKNRVLWTFDRLDTFNKEDAEWLVRHAHIEENSSPTTQHSPTPGPEVLKILQGLDELLIRLHLKMTSLEDKLDRIVEALAEDHDPDEMPATYMDGSRV